MRKRKERRNVVRVPAALGALAFAIVYASGAVSEMNRASRVFGAFLGLPTLCLYWCSAAAYGAFAYLLSIAEEAKGGAKEEAENADV